ncbi:MAG: ABC transporter ATP-binding protein [Campylobacterales bacterium]|nr:ABC transporter ATP-binding protein [Campylobacterales bacterium]
MQHMLLYASDISHTFDYKLFNAVDLSLEVKNSIAIVGRSGSGKSTLLHNLSTFLKPTSGSVKLFGEDVYTLDESKIEKIRRFKLGMIFQNHYLFRGMRARTNIELASMLSDSFIDQKVLDTLEIANLLEQKTSELSGGQQQRISIARVLAKRPKLIFADEPTGNLDKQSAHLVMDVLLEAVKENNGAMIIVTHDEEIAQRCERVYMLSDKKLELVS